MPVDIPRLNEASVDARALALGLVVVTVTTVFFGLLPAVLLLKRSMTSDLKSGERGSSRGARRVYSVLVTAEVAFACALLVSSVLLVRTVRHMMDTPMGVQAEEVLVTTVQVTPAVVPRGTRGAAGVDHRRHHPRGHPGCHPAAAGRAVRRRQQFPAARDRLAESVPAPGATDARPPG